MLNRIADVLDERFGPHPTVPFDQLKPINAELVNASEFDNKEELLAAINEWSEQAYRDEGLPMTSA